MLWGLGVWTQGFAPARQALYHLSHVSSPFRSGYFGNRVSLFFPGPPTLQSSYFMLPTYIWNYRSVPPHPAFFHWDGISWTFWPQLVWNWDTPNLSLLCSLGWRPQYPAICWDGVSLTFCPGRPWSMTLLILASQVAMIIGISCQCLALQWYGFQALLLWWNKFIHIAPHQVILKAYHEKQWAFSPLWNPHACPLDNHK
jgi:hypothetical protein